MFISHKYRTIFIHIQRTGGNSIQRIFEAHDPELIEAVAVAPQKQRTKHCYVEDIREAVSAEVFDGYLKFAVVRNPFDRMVSWYSHFKGDKNPEDAGINFRADSRSYDVGDLAQLADRHESIGQQVRHAVQKHAANFAEFLRLPKDYPGGLFNRLYANQLDYVSVEDQVRADRILKFEDLSRDFADLADELGFAGRLPHVNRSDRRPAYQPYYDPDTRELLEQRFARDCEYFGYVF